MVAPSYSNRRSDAAKAIGLGQKPAAKPRHHPLITNGTNVPTKAEDVRDELTHVRFLF